VLFRSELTKTLSDPVIIGNITKKFEQQQVSEDKKKPQRKEKETRPKEEAAKTSDNEYSKTAFSKVYGSPKIISKLSQLTDQYAEYSVSYRKFIHDSVIVLDFEVSNTIEDNILKNVTIEVVDVIAEDGFDFSHGEMIEIESLKYGELKHIYFKINKLTESVYSTCHFNIQLKYDVQEIDAKGNPHGPPYKDTYKPNKNSISVRVSDYYRNNTKVNLENFDECWKKTASGDFFNVEETFVLPHPTIKAAATSISNLLGFDPLNDLEKLDVNVKKFEISYATVSYLDSMVFIKLQIANQNSQCLAKIYVRSQEEEIAQMESILETMKKQ